jgi:hypothetical protein
MGENTGIVSIEGGPKVCSFCFDWQENPLPSGELDKLLEWVNGGIEEHRQ